MPTYSGTIFMTNTYLLEVIKALQPIERQEMTHFLASPLFNTGGNAEELIRLYQSILDTAPDFSGESLRKEIVYSKVFKESTAIQGKLEKLMADLNKLLRNYSLMKRRLSEINEVQHQVEWAAWLRERGLAERARQVLTKLQPQKQQDTSESLEGYRKALMIAEEQHEWESMYNQAKGDLNIPRVINYLELYFYNYKMELANRYLVQQNKPNYRT